MVVLNRVNKKWWWVEVEGRMGYAPANYLSSDVIEVCDEPWQDSEYFLSYSSLVSQIVSTNIAQKFFSCIFAI